VKSSYLLYAIYLLPLTSCNSSGRANAPIKVDSITVQQFLNGRKLCDIALARGFHPIQPQMEPWATNPVDTFVESYVINGKWLTISQPLKRPENIKDSARIYTYDNKRMTTVRVIIDSLHFNFNKVTFDYGSFPQNVFRRKNVVLLKNPPMTWCGLANRYKFIQMFDLNSMTCYEMLADEYSCLPEDPNQD
jgi:hypothetical protein